VEEEIVTEMEAVVEKQGKDRLVGVEEEVVVTEQEVEMVEMVAVFLRVALYLYQMEIKSR